jgi:hypothetical protein
LCSWTRWPKKVCQYPQLYATCGRASETMLQCKVSHLPSLQSPYSPQFLLFAWFIIKMVLYTPNSPPCVFLLMLKPIHLCEMVFLYMPQPLFRPPPTSSSPTSQIPRFLFQPLWFSLSPPQSKRVPPFFHHHHLPLLNPERSPKTLVHPSPPHLSHVLRQRVTPRDPFPHIQVP